MDLRKWFGRRSRTEPVGTRDTLDSLNDSHSAIQKAIQEAVEETRRNVKTALEDIRQEAVQAPARGGNLDVELEARPMRPEIRPHAFVIMPFGTKKGTDGTIFDFNAIYSQLIKPTLELAGFEAFRADEETTSGDILTDMFQELLLADLCIVDMSIDNANVFYELGIRHALRKRGVVHIQAGRAYMPFDVFNVRTIPYHITAEGVPDPEFLEKDRQAIVRVTRDTWASGTETVHSPIFNLLDGLAEPDRRMLRTPLATGFWREYNRWKERLAIAQRQKRIGDILLLTEEIQNPLIKEEALGEAGQALKNMGRHELALTQYQKGLQVNPRNRTFRREEALNLNRLGRADEAIIKIEQLLADFPDDTEALAILGRIHKEMWYDSWKWIPDLDLRMKTAFDSYHWLLKSFEAYLRGFRVDLNQTYPGINALTLGTLLVHLADQNEDPDEPDPDIEAVRGILAELRGALAFALESRAADDQADYWSLVSLAELRVLTARARLPVARAYRKAFTAARRNPFFLQSSLGQLEILQALDFRSDFVQIGVDALQAEIRRIRKQKAAEETGEDKTIRGKSGKLGERVSGDGQVFLFAGYMVDHPGKQHMMFPAARESEVRQAIEGILDKYEACSKDLAITAGLASGSELIFAEICTARDIPLESHLPMAEAGYVRDFISPCGDEWVERFYRVRNHPLAYELYQEDQVGPPGAGDDLHERNNRWALYSSLAKGVDKVRLIALWDGKGGRPKDRDARLVNHMVELMRETGGIVEHIHTAKIMHSPSADGVEWVSEPPADPLASERPASDGR